MKVQDIRSFFNKPKAGSSGGGAPSTPEAEVVDVPSRLRRGRGGKKKEDKDDDDDGVLRGPADTEESPSKKKNENRRSSSGGSKGRKKAPAISDDSDGEDPLPKTVRDKKEKESKGREKPVKEDKKSSERKRKAKVLSDSEEEDFNPKKKSVKKEETTPVASSSKSSPMRRGGREKEKKESETTPKKPHVDVDPAEFFKVSDEKRKVQQANYSKYLAKVNAKPKNLGMKEVPEGAPDCLAGLTFVITGVLDSLERDACKDIVEQYGGRVTGGVSKKTSYLIIGDDPGESKTKKAKELNVPQITEDGFFEILRKSNPTPIPEAKEQTMDIDSEEEDFNPKKKAIKKEEMTPVASSSKSSPMRKGRREKEKTDSEAPKKAHVDASPVPDEKRKVQQANYSKYLAKVNAKPKNLGMKEVPEGVPDCLAGLTFVITGVLDSLERDACKDIVEQYGGRVTGSVSRKTSYLIIGDDPGESKTKKAKELNVPEITEDGLFEMLRKSNPTPVPKPVEQPMDIEEPDEQQQTRNKRKVESKGSSVSPKKPKTSSPTKLKNTTTDSNAKASPKPASIPVPPLPTKSVTQDQMWVDKYKPKTLKNVVGQGKDNSNAAKLSRWLRDWFKNHGSSQEKPKAAWPGLKDPEGKTFKCALLSGPPGIGKTTTAHLACREIGYDYYELNASDTRNKSGLKQHVADALTSKSLFVGANDKGQLTSHHVLIMDEVDGMSGNEDRGGVQELIALIKSSRIPIICICNDRNHQKIRSLANYCFDLRFNKPTIQELKGYVSSICFKEKLKIEPERMTQLMISTDQDIRQILHQLQMYRDGNAQQILNPKKDLRFGPWDVCRKVFSKSEHEKMSIHDKTGLFFQDYSFGPLFVQENYLKQIPVAAKGNKYKRMELISKSASSIADADLVDNIIRRTNNWSMLPVSAIFASYVPGEHMASSNIGPIEFPQWLGKNSNRTKRHRLLQSLHTHVHLQVSGSLEALNMDYLPYLRRFIVDPLVASDVEKAAERMETYALLRDDLESINDLALWPRMKNPMDKVDTKTKSAFTRAVNKEVLPYSNVKIVKGKSKAKTDELEGLEDEDEAEDEEEEEETVEKDAMIKMKTRKEAASSSKAGASSTKSKGKKDVDEKPARGKGSRAKK